MNRNLRLVKRTIENRLRETGCSPDWRDSIAVDRGADRWESKQLALQREIVCQRLNRNADLARDLRGALDRLTDGTYGNCLQCGKPISANRLLAVPWAALCISCQQKVEREEAYGIRERLAA